MLSLVGRFLLPALFLLAAVYVLVRSPGQNPTLSYFLSAVLLGMALASGQRAWQGGDRKHK